MSKDIDVEEDEMDLAWVIAPTEACWFTSLAVFASKRHAEIFLTALRKSKERNNTYDDLAILPARASVVAANTYDTRAGRAALKKDAAKEGIER